MASTRYKPPRKKWDWRQWLTDEEAAILLAIDNAKAQWQELNAQRAAITNRAIQRARTKAGIKR